MAVLDHLGHRRGVGPPSVVGGGGVVDTDSDGTLGWYKCKVGTTPSTFHSGPV